MSTPREGCCAAAVGDSIFVMGGQNGDDGHLRSCERYELDHALHRCRIPAPLILYASATSLILGTESKI
jgi:hypothetical protein